MQNFAAIDFETANAERTSVCAVGVVVVRDGQVTDTFYSLIQPEPNYYSYLNFIFFFFLRRDYIIYDTSFSLTMNFIAPAGRPNASSSSYPTTSSTL